MKTTMFKRVFAMLMLVMVLVSMCSVTAFAAYNDASGQEVAGCKLPANKTYDQYTEEQKICYKMQEMFGKTSTVVYSTVKSDTCKYQTAITIGDSTRNIFVSAKPTAGGVNVQVGADGQLVVDGITSDDTSVWNQLFDRFKGIIVGLTGIGTLVMIVLFIIQFMKLGSSAGNPQARSQALTGVLWTGVAAALLGSVTIIVGFFYNAI
jgi:hypothetical protein